MAKARPHILFSLMILMLAGLFTSRALLAIAMVVFVILSCLHDEFKGQVRRFLNNRLLWAISLLFILPFISGLWSEDNYQWLEMVRTKLPLLLMPFAFAAPFGLSKAQWKWLSYAFVGMTIMACGWTLVEYAADSETINTGYLQAKTMWTPLENDHVRFSWLVYAAALTAGWHFYSSVKRGAAVFWLTLGLLLVIYLHLLAARTGLLAFYSSLLLLLFWSLRHRAKKYFLPLIMVNLLLPLAAWFIFPSFQNKLKYLNYEKEYFRKGAYLPHSNDGVRVISLTAGWNIMNAAPLAGVGYGDILFSTRKWYAEHYPSMEESDKIFPSSQFLLYGCGLGWPGLLAFVVVMLIPFFTVVAFPLPWYMLNSSLALSFLFDIGLEVQYGVFIYSFFVLWWWKWMKTQNMASL